MMNQFIKILITDAELSLPARGTERPEIEMKGILEHHRRLVAGDLETVINGYAVEASVLREADHGSAGSAFVDFDKKHIHVVAYADPESFDQMAAQLASPAKALLTVEMPGLRYSDEEGGSTHWEGKGASFGQELASVTLTTIIK